MIKEELCHSILVSLLCLLHVFPSSVKEEEKGVRTKDIPVRVRCEIE